jgi:hypothetical protein
VFREFLHNLDRAGKRAMRERNGNGSHPANNNKAGSVKNGRRK